MAQSNDGPTMTIEEAGRALGKSPRTTAMLVARGELQTVAPGVVSVDSVEEWRTRRDAEGPFRRVLRAVKAMLRWMPP